MAWLQLLTGRCPSGRSRLLAARCTRRLHSFASLGLMPELCEAAQAQGFAQPSPIQQLAIPAVLKGSSVAIAASTGSGKTMAYMMPLLHRLKAEEASEPELRYELRPRALVLAPTRDLSKQIFDAAKVCTHPLPPPARAALTLAAAPPQQMSHACRARVRLLTADAKLGQQRMKLKEGADVIISTPARLLLLHRIGAPAQCRSSLILEARAWRAPSQ